MNKQSSLNISQDSTEEFSSNRNLIAPYQSDIKVSRKIFNLQSKTERNSPEPTTVFDRLFIDFSRRQIAQKKLSEIIDLKKTQAKSLSLHIPNFTKEKSNRALKKSEVESIIDRLNKYWERKWMKIEMRKKEIAEKEEKEFRKMVRIKKNSDPQVFSRLTTSKKRSEFEELIRNREKKVFSLKEAIESGKRLMGKAKVLKDFIPTPCVSPIWNARCKS